MIKKTALIVLFLTLCLALLPCGIFADEKDDYIDEGKRLIDDLPQSARKYVDGTENFDAMSIFEVIKGVLSDTASYLKIPLRIFLVFAAVAVGSSAMLALGAGIKDNPLLKSNSLIFSAGAVASCGPVLVECVRGGVAALETVHSFSLSFVPLFTGLLVSCGEISKSLIFGSFTAIFSQVTSGFLQYMLTPFVGLMLGLSVVSAMGEGQIFEIISGIRKITVWVTGLVTTIFFTVMSLQSFIGATGDTLTIKTGKLLVGSFVPIVGGSIADAMSTVLSGMKIIKGTVGVVAIIALCALLLPQLICMLMCSFSLKASEIFCNMLGVHGLGTTARSLSFCVEICTALLSFRFVTFIFSVSVMLTVSG
ncbi:MAG: hypothetical protein RRY69_02835 [Oscillospiraceae bacterium]